jgi:hypothetical protein
MVMMAAVEQPTPLGVVVRPDHGNGEEAKEKGESSDNCAIHLISSRYV